jgi:limonene-1,2-epoxide hydrolase
MIDRRNLLTGFGAASLLAAAPARAGLTMPARDHFERFLEIINAWKQHDIDAVLARVTDDIVWYAYVGVAPVVGKPAMRAMLEKMAPNRGAERWRIFYHAINGDRLFVEGVDDWDDKAGHRLEVPYAGVVEFKNGLVSGWRDYFDLGLLTRMKNGEPVPAEIEPLVSRTGRP